MIAVGGKGEITSGTVFDRAGGRDEPEKVPEKSSAAKCKQTMNVPLVVARSYERSFVAPGTYCLDQEKLGFGLKRGFGG